MSDSESLDIADTGARRTKMRARYDLVSPVALNRVARLYKAGLGDRFIGYPLHELLSRALRHSYLFLAGNGPRELELATLAVLEAVAIDRDEQRSPWLASEESETGYDLIPLSALDAIAEAAHEGAVNHGVMNWENGMDVPTCLNHGIKHVRNRLGDAATGEDESGHAAWNYFAAIHSLKLWPGVNAGKLRSGGCRAPGADPSIFSPPAAQVGSIAPAARLDFEAAIKAIREATPAPAVWDAFPTQDIRGGLAAAFKATREASIGPAVAGPVAQATPEEYRGKLTLSADTGFEWRRRPDHA